MKNRTVFLGIVVLAMLAHRQAIAEPAGKRTEEPKLTIVNVSSHCDWCLGHTRLWHEQRYAEIVRQVLLLMRSHPHYVWLLETENEELRPFLAKARSEWPEMIDEFWQRVREGRIEVIVGVSNPRLTEIYPETMVRNLVLGKEYFRRHVPGLAQQVYNVVDLMCGPSQMPQILSQAEYRYFMFSRPVGPEVVFWCKGLDGTRMLSARCFYGYDAMGTFGQPVKGFLPVPIWREAIGGDDVLPDPTLPQLASGWDRQKKVIATNSRYFEEVEKCGAAIAEWNGPLDSLECYVEAGLHGDRSLYMHNNQDEDLLLCLEKALVMAWKSGEPIDAGRTDDLWRDVLSCTGHAIQCAWTADYSERLSFAHHRRGRIEQALDEALTVVTDGIHYRLGLGAPLVVFNFHAWPVTGPVEFAVEGSSAGLVLRDGDGQKVPIQFSSEAKSGEPVVAFVAERVPACGHKTFYLNRDEGRTDAPRRSPPTEGLLRTSGTALGCGPTVPWRSSTSFARPGSCSQMLADWETSYTIPPRRRTTGR